MTAIKAKEGLSARLKELRRLKGYSQDKLEEVSGVNRNTIAKLETKPAYRQDQEIIATLAKHLSSTFNYLMYGITDVDTFSVDARAIAIRIDRISDNKKKARLVKIMLSLFEL